MVTFQIVMITYGLVSIISPRLAGLGLVMLGLVWYLIDIGVLVV